MTSKCKDCEAYRKKLTDNIKNNGTTSSYEILLNAYLKHQSGHYHT